MRKPTAKITIGIYHADVNYELSRIKFLCEDMIGLGYLYFDIDNHKIELEVFDITDFDIRLWDRNSLEFKIDGSEWDFDIEYINIKFM